MFSRLSRLEKTCMMVGAIVIVAVAVLLANTVAAAPASTPKQSQGNPEILAQIASLQAQLNDTQA